MDATLGQLTGNVDIVDFVSVTFLRASEPRAYQLLWQHRAELTGTSVSLPSRRDERPEQGIECWRTRLQDAGVAEQHLNGVIGLMGMLFAPLRQALGHIPDDDLPEHTFDTALQQLADGTPGPEVDGVAKAHIEQRGATERTAIEQHGETQRAVIAAEVGRERIRQPQLPGGDGDAA